MTEQTESAVERLAWSKGPCPNGQDGLYLDVDMTGERYTCTRCSGTGEVYLYLGTLLEECHWCELGYVHFTNAPPEPCDNCDHTGYIVISAPEEKLWELVAGLDAPEYTRFLHLITGRGVWGDTKIWIGRWMRLTSAERREFLAAALEA